MYAKGWGVTQDYSAAMGWYRKAADQGHAEAQYNLGDMYYFGKGVTTNEVEALKWINLADLADLSCGKACVFRVVLTAYMTDTEIYKANRLTKKWLKEHPDFTFEKDSALILKIQQ